MKSVVGVALVILVGLLSPRFSLGVDNTKYHRYTEIVSYLHGFETSYKNIGVSTGSLNFKTAEGRDIPFLKITGGNGFNKKRIFVEAGIHGRELMGPATTLYFIERLLERRELDSDAYSLFNNFDWYFVPLANPDGYEYSQTVELWRKNRRFMSVAECGTSIIHGVDLNRNFDVFWKTAGASSSCTSDVYHGPFPFSEPETQGIRDKLRDIIREDGPISAYIAINAYGQMLLTPYSHTGATLPPNHAIVTNVTNAARDAIKAVTGKDYIVGPAASVSYEASGTGTDWANIKENIPYSLSFSVRPKIGDMNGFNPAPSEIVPTGMDVWAGIAAIAPRLRTGPF